jgi:hypothetical protein
MMIVLAIFGWIVTIIWELYAKDPIVDFRLPAARNFAIVALLFVFGLGLFARQRSFRKCCNRYRDSARLMPVRYSEPAHSPSRFSRPFRPSCCNDGFLCGDNDLYEVRLSASRAKVAVESKTGEAGESCGAHGRLLDKRCDCLGIRDID